MACEIGIGCDALEALPNVPWPVLDTASHQLGMYVVELAGECPLLFKIVNLERQVGRHAGMAVLGGIAGKCERADTAYLCG
jgi:hypothetical protein